MAELNKKVNNQNEEEEEKSKKKYLLLLLLLLLIIMTLVAGMFILISDRNRPVDPPDYQLKPDDTNAETMPGDPDDDKLEAPSGGGSAVSIQYSDKISINLSTGKMTLKMGNPYKSLSSMTVKVIVQNVTIFESGLLRPGHQLRELTLPKDTLKMLSEGKYNGKFSLQFFNEEGEKSIVESDIPVTITVKK